MGGGARGEASPSTSVSRTLSGPSSAALRVYVVANAYLLTASPAAASVTAMPGATTPMAAAPAHKIAKRPAAEEAARVHVGVGH